MKDYFVVLATKGEKIPWEEDRKLDHGVLSALIYMKLVSFGFLLIRKIENIDEKKLSLRQRKTIRFLREKIGIFDYNRNSFNQFVRIAWAIAMHNITPHATWPPEAESMKSFNEVMFPIRRKDSFLACLLYLVDTLQEWDRDRLRISDFCLARRFIPSKL